MGRKTPQKRQSVPHAEPSRISNLLLLASLACHCLLALLFVNIQGQVLAPVFGSVSLSSHAIDGFQAVALILGIVLQGSVPPSPLLGLCGGLSILGSDISLPSLAMKVSSLEPLRQAWAARAITVLPLTFVTASTLQAVSVCCKKHKD